MLSITRLSKLFRAASSLRLLRALLEHRVLASAEHRQVLCARLNSVIDIGANRGQFALAARLWAPKSRVVSFEPLPDPAQTFRKVFEGDGHVILHEAAIGPRAVTQEMHVSARDDSSSLLPIAALQSHIFPGTAEVATISVKVAPLEAFLRPADIKPPAMLKLDVQGFEYEALRGCESLLSRFDFVYCECSFVELYLGQKLAADMISWLAERGFQIKGVFNAAYDGDGQAVQADFLFARDVTAGRPS